MIINKSQKGVMAMRKKIYFLILIICVLFFWLGTISPDLLAQAGRGKARLKGLVLDEAGKPIPSAKVVLELLSSEQIKKELKTNKKGEWIILGLGSGNWQVTASAEGYIPSKTTIFVSQIEKNPKVVLKLKKIEVATAEALKKEGTLDILDQATTLYEQRKYDEALSILNELLTKNPDVYQIKILMGDCHREKGEVDKAIELYTEAVQKSQNDEQAKEITAKTLAALGDCYLKKGDIEKAQSYFKQSIETYPDNETLAYNVGEIYFSNQKPDEAIHYFQLATQINPKSPLPYYKLGLVYLHKADFKKAEETLSKFLELQPEGEHSQEVRNLLNYLKSRKK